MMTADTSRNAGFLEVFFAQINHLGKKNRLIQDFTPEYSRVLGQGGESQGEEEKGHQGSGTYL